MEQVAKEVGMLLRESSVMDIVEAW